MQQKRAALPSTSVAVMAMMVAIHTHTHRIGIDKKNELCVMHRSPHQRDRTPSNEFRMNRN